MNNLVSVIVPVYKAECFLEDAVDSILRQTYKNLEIILVDDGSPDNCPAICDDYAKKDARIKVIHKENGGLASARNAGIEIAAGKYIVSIDDDDILNENYISVLYNICEKYGCDIAQCDFLMTNEKSILLQPQKNMKVEIFDARETMKNFCVESNLTKYWVVWNKMYRRELFDDISYPLGKIHEDMYTSHKLLWKSRKTAVTNLYLYYYFQREGTITGKKTTISERIDVIEALKEEMEFFEENKLYDEYAFMLLKYYFTICKTYEEMPAYPDYEMKKSVYAKVMEKYKKEALDAKETILKLPKTGMLTKIRTIYPTLSEEDKEFFEKVYGSRVSPTFVCSFDFPIEKIRSRDRIAIYGAGKVGQSFYNQMKEKKYGELAVWVDNGFKNHIRMGLPVQPIDALLRCDFDKVIIAVQRRDVADEIKENLINWGIDEDKIIADLPVPVDRGSRMRAEFIEDTRKMKSGGNESRWILMNTPDHDNLGDHLLTMGTIEFIKDYFPDKELVEITGRQWDKCKDEIVPKISTKDIIGIVGGGFMGDLWPGQDGRVKEIIETFKDNRIIFLPQTFYYGKDENSILKDDVELYNSRNKILFIHREKSSYDFFTKNVVKNFTRNACFPDLALYLKGRAVKHDRSGILFCMRMDKESVNDDVRSRLLDLAGKVRNDVEIIDTVLDKSVLRSERQDEVSFILDTISKAELLITDRLHAMIMAALTGTPCIALDNLTKKVSGVYQWIETVDYVTCVNAADVDSELIQKYMAAVKDNYDRTIVEGEFRKMYEFIMNCLER